MKASKKRGFTIIELVIVIAVVAILAAVLIPVFSNVVKQAKEANDTVMVRNLNTALKTDGKKHSTMTEALDTAKGAGYDVTKISNTASNNEILWDSVNDCFVYMKDGKINYIPDSKTETVAAADTYKYFRIFATTEGVADSEYSVYLAGTSATGDITVKSGFDAGENAGIASVTYAANAGHEVTIRTNGGMLNVNAAADTVKHYGDVEKVVITAVAGDSYHENGVAKVLVVSKGHVSIAKSASVNMLVVDTATPTDVKLSVETGATVVSASVPNEVVGADTLPATVSSLTVSTVNTVAELNEKVGAKTGNVYVKLGSDIAAGNVSISVAPDGGDANITIDGDGHVVTSSHNRMIQTCADSKKEGFVPYGGNLTIANVVLKNECASTPNNIRAISLWEFVGTLNLSNSEIEMPTAKDNYGVNLVDCGGEVVINIKNTKITAYQCVNIYGNNRTVNIDNCQFISRNMHNVEYFGGCVALLENSSANITINNTSMTVEETEGYIANGFVVLGSALGDPNVGLMTINGCTANGKNFSIENVRKSAPVEVIISIDGTNFTK